MTTLLTVAFLAAVSSVGAQTSLLEVSPRVKLPGDSVESGRLLSSLGQFLMAADNGAEGNEWVYGPDRLPTEVLLRELADLGGKPADRDQEAPPPAFRPQLLNVVPMDKGQYFVQLSFIGHEDGLPVIGASVELLAHSQEDRYLFSSPLTRNTHGWKVLRLGNMSFHYRDEVNLPKAQEFHRLVTLFDGKLESAPEVIAFYFFDDDVEVQRALGLPYKLEYNGEGGISRWGGRLDGQEIYLMGQGQFASFDPHDLWHSRLSKVKPRKEVNHAVDEGIATLYGGSWGLTWEEMLAAFREQIEMHAGTDWLAMKAAKVRFETRGHNNPTDFMINALFVKKIEAQMGFAGVWELLNAKEEPAYFAALKKCLGITDENYNQVAWGLVEAELSVQGFLK